MTTPYINMIAPNHERTSCSDDSLYNAAYSLEDHGGYGRCHRCTLMKVFQMQDQPLPLEEEEDF